MSYSVHIRLQLNIGTKRKRKKILILSLCDFIHVQPWVLLKFSEILVIMSPNIARLAQSIMVLHSSIILTILSFLDITINDGMADMLLLLPPRESPVQILVT